MVRDWLPKAGKLASVFLDFCGPLSGDTLDIAAIAQKCLEENGYLGMGVLRGRESPNQARAHFNKKKRRFIPRHVAPKVQRTVHERLNSETGSPSIKRLILALETLTTKAYLAKGNYFSPDCLIDYQSTTDVGVGVPMTYFGGPVHKGGSRVRRLVSLAVSNDKNAQIDTLLQMSDPLETGEAIADWENSHWEEWGKGDWFPSQSECLLNISEETLETWRVNRDQGLYGEHPILGACIGRSEKESDLHTVIVSGGPYKVPKVLKVPKGVVGTKENVHLYLQ